MVSPINEKSFVARMGIYNLLTIDLPLPFHIGIFSFNNYPDRVALEYHLGQGEQSAVWDYRYPKWYNYVEFPFNRNIDCRLPKQLQAPPDPAEELLSKFLTVLQLYSTIPLGGHIHAIKSATSTDFTKSDVSLAPKNIGGNPCEPEVFFITKDNLEGIKQHFDSLWNKDQRLISLAASRYMHSYTQDIFSEGFELENAFMNLMFALENLFGSPEAVGFKIALRAACFLEVTGEKRRELNRKIKNWYKKRSLIAHGTGNRVVEWKDVEELREIVRQAIMGIWILQKKGDDLDDYLFLGERYDHISNNE